ncbi:hypothetical protein MKEN_00372100 [Mycena kentingensis (nom. inval.)]|nr:hypothetical protein MKEN_00372100 [Mycena kentingensis (nom. inval.)]
MATPSSSATSPSPILPSAPPLSATVTVTSVVPDAQQRRRAAEKFKARAEISNITRNLRTRLSYASYKATHNLAHLPLRDLEAQSQTQIQIYARTMAAKRKASALSTSYSVPSPGTNNYYNNPATQGAASGSGPVRRPSSGSIQPAPSLGSRSYYSTGAGGSGAEPPRTQTLFTSILAPPPSQQARTILNANDPPLAASSRPPASPRARSKVAARSIAEGTRASHKSRADDKHEKRKTKRAADKGKQKQRRVSHVDADGDVDMKAAATLTSLLMHSRPSMGSASSPRSSLDESDAASLSHFAQTSSRGPVTQQSSLSAIPDLHRASATPPPMSTQQQSTPHAGPSDNEAADLMLFLATSPSPVRKGDQRDLAAYRALNDGAPKAASAGTLRGAESFTSTVSSIGGDMRGATPGTSRTSTPVPTHAASPVPVPAAAPVSRVITPSPAQLLPPPTMPLPMPASLGAPSPTPRQDVLQLAQPQPQQQPPTADFNFNEYLHPSPAPTLSQPIPGPPKQNLGLRADVGRKLFEEEQMRHHAAMAMNAQGTPTPPKPRVEERTLGAGIDLVQSSG